MALAATVVTALIALLHLYILVLEMFLWDKPAGRRAFGMSLEQAQATKTLAANQGLYNGFLAAGLLWGVATDRQDVALFFLGCVTLAALYGAWSVSRRIFYVQGVPALLALAATLLAG